MDSRDIDRLCAQGEGATVEFKGGGKGVRDDTFESYCAFFDEADVFTVTIPLDDDHSPEAGIPGQKGASLLRERQGQWRPSALEAIRTNPRVSAKRIAERLGMVSEAQVRSQLPKWQQEGLLRREGPTGNGGRWILERPYGNSPSPADESSTSLVP